MQIRVDHTRRRMLFSPSGMSQTTRFKHREIFVLVSKIAVNVAKQIVSVLGPEPSKPGEPPHRQTGEGQESIEHGWDQDLAMPYLTSNEYMWDLEFGTTTIAPRPWMRRTIEAIEPILRHMIDQAESS